MAIKKDAPIQDEYYSRNLPHLIPSGWPVFVTWNLKGALPRHVLEMLEAEKRRLDNSKAVLKSPTDDVRQRRRSTKALFALRDRYLDRCKANSLNLGYPRAARIICESLLWGVPERYQLFAYSVMPSHVHALIEPTVQLRSILQGIKGFTAREINRVQNQVGRCLWQSESYDHYARDEEEVGRIIEYIEFNPVSAGLCRRPEEWPWSSASFRAALDWPYGAPFDVDRKREAIAGLTSAWKG